MKVALLDKTGKKTEKKVELSSAVFGTKVNQKLLSQAVYTYLSNQRQANAHTKDRGDVRGGGKKPWKQKGTGRARHGSSRSPIWRGGGVTFGPTNDRNYKKEMPKKMRKAAIRAAFSYLTKENKVLVMEKPTFKEGGLTAQILKIMGNAKVDRKVMFVQNEIDKNFVNAVSNLEKISVKPVGELNAYSLLNTNWLILTDESLDKINEFWGGAKPKVETKEKIVKVAKKAAKTTKKAEKKPAKKATKKAKK